MEVAPSTRDHRGAVVAGEGLHDGEWVGFDRGCGDVPDEAGAIAEAAGANDEVIGRDEPLQLGTITVELGRVVVFDCLDE